MEIDCRKLNGTYSLSRGEYFWEVPFSVPFLLLRLNRKLCKYQCKISSAIGNTRTTINGITVPVSIEKGFLGEGHNVLGQRFTNEK